MGDICCTAEMASRSRMGSGFVGGAVRIHAPNRRGLRQGLAVDPFGLPAGQNPCPESKGIETST